MYVTKHFKISTTDCDSLSTDHGEWPKQGKSFSHVSRWFFFLSSQVPFTAVGNKYASKKASMNKTKVSVILSVFIVANYDRKTWWAWPESLTWRCKEKRIDVNVYKATKHVVFISLN